MMKHALTSTALALTLASGVQADELRVSWWGGDSRHTVTQEALAYCGPKVGHTTKAEFMGFEGYLERLTTQLAGGTEADIVQVDWPWLYQFSQDGTGFADLRDHADVIDLTQWSEDQLRPAEMNGRLNGLPASITGAVMFYNEAAFTSRGLAVPKSWDDLAAAAKVFNAEGAYPIDATKVILMFLIESFAAQSAGKEIVDPETGELAWTAEDLTKALNQYQWMLDNGIVRPWKEAAAAGNIEVFDDPAWASGKLGGTYFWTSTYSKFNDPLADGSLVPAAPLRIEGAQSDGIYRKPSMLFAISKNAQNPKAAAELLNCLMTDPQAIAILGDSRGLPASAVGLKTLNDAGKVTPVQQEAARIVAEATGPVMSPVIEHPSVQEVLRDNLEQFAYGQMTVEETAETIISDLERALRRL